MAKKSFPVAPMITAGGKLGVLTKGDAKDFFFALSGLVSIVQNGETQTDETVAYFAEFVNGNARFAVADNVFDFFLRGVNFLFVDVVRLLGEFKALLKKIMEKMEKTALSYYL